MRSFFSVRAGWLLVLLGLVGGVGACARLPVPEEPPRSTPTRPLWSDEALREHLRFFNAAQVEGRATGTAGYAVAAAYVAARLAEFELQPVLGEEFQMIYTTPVNEIRAASLIVTGPDTLAFYPGVDYLPDGRSDSGRVEIRAVWLAPEGSAGVDPLPASAVLLPAAQAATASLRALRDAGARVVFIVGPLTPRPAAASIVGLQVVQVTPGTAALMLGATLAGLADQWRDAAHTARRLPRRMLLRVEAQARSHVGALNVLGYVPGKHPRQAQDLVIVCADLDAVGTFAGVPTLDPARLGVGAAALLEAARQYSYFGQYGAVPERTLLFAVFSGARHGHAGLRSYLRQPVWALDQTRAVIYVGLDPAEEPAVRDLLAAYGLPLYPVFPPADTLLTTRVMLRPARRPPRRRTLRERGEEGYRSTPPRLSDLLDAGEAQARRLADSLNTLLLREAVSPAAFMPVSPDTLPVPDVNQ